MTDYRSIISLEPGKRGGKPCIRGLRITVQDVLGWLASGMSSDEIVADYPELTKDDVLACLAFAADREKHAAWCGWRREAAVRREPIPSDRTRSTNCLSRINTGRIGRFGARQRPGDMGLRQRSRVHDRHQR